MLYWFMEFRNSFENSKIDFIIITVLFTKVLNSFADELSLQQALRDFTNLVSGSLNLDWRLQFLLSYHLRKLSQVFRSITTIKFFKNI